MKIDESYARSPKWKRWKFLPFIIEEPPLQLKKEEVPPIEPNDIFAHFDDEKITFRLSSNKLADKGFSNMLFIGAAIIVIGMQLVPYITIKEIGPSSLTEHIVVLSIGLIIASTGLYFRLRSKSIPEHVYLTLYRLRGLVELPRDHGGKESFLVHFSDLKVLKKSITTPNVHIGAKIMFIRDASTRLIPKSSDWIGMSWSNNPMEYWSFYVWYMDKNRPLPPGSAFDPYRKKDFERRKAEGFPAPLFESKIPTPEYVPGSEGSIVDNLN